MLLRLAGVSLILLPSLVGAQSPTIEKIDPPNWWVNLPAPMLLLHGDYLSGATFTLSDPSLHLDHVSTSANGHFAQLWLGADPVSPVELQITATTPQGHTSVSFRVQPRRPTTSAPMSQIADILRQDEVYPHLPPDSVASLSVAP